LNLLLATFLTMGAWAPLAALAVFALGMTFVHQGAFDAAAALDVMQSQVLATTLALAANAVIPQFAITGATDTYLINTANAPGTQTTRTAAQLYADLTAQLGFPPPNGYQYSLTISHGGTGTLTLAGGTGVTFSSVTAGTATSIATTTGREYLVTIVNPTTVTIVNLASLAS
jgi:hypothetical protein